MNIIKNIITEKIFEEYNIVKNDTGLFDFSIEGKIIVKRDGRINFINGLVSNDIKNLENFNSLVINWIKIWEIL